jgi:hypothetical protein
MAAGADMGQPCFSRLPAIMHSRMPGPPQLTRLVTSSPPAPFAALQLTMQERERWLVVASMHVSASMCVLLG